MPRVPGSAIAFGLGIGLLFLSILSGGEARTPSVAASGHDLVARGEYLANTTCVNCHSPRVVGDPYRIDRTKLFAGWEEFPGPWGVVYARNITPDMDTGIGSWSVDDIKRSVRDGVAKDGTKLLVMPWEIFRGLSDDDLTAIATYLKSIPGIRNPIAPAKLAPPDAVAGFVNSIPPLRAAVPPALYSQPRDVFHDFFFGNPVVTPAMSQLPPSGFQAPQGKDSIERGVYLSQNILACTACHGPNLAGGIPPFFAANITPDKETGIGSWSKAQIVKALREGIRPEGRRLSPAMPSADLGYGPLTDDDVYNVIAYIQSIPAVRRAPGEPNPAMPGPPPGPPGPPPPPPPPPGTPASLPRTGESPSVFSLVVAAVLLGGGALGLGLRVRYRRTPS